MGSFNSQPRLAVVTQTISRAGSDLVHFMIIVVIIFMSFVASGMFLFGRKIWSFSSMFYSMNTCFRMMLGDFEWETLGEEHPLTAAIWFGTYMLLLMLLLLNMLMAII